MKSLFIAFALVIASYLHANQEDLTTAQVLAAQKTIKENGYTCDTVDGKPFFSDSYTIEISCNNRYRYLLEDIGGRWIVRIK